MHTFDNGELVGRRAPGQDAQPPPDDVEDVLPDVAFGIQHRAPEFRAVQYQILASLLFGGPQRNGICSRNLRFLVVMERDRSK